MDITISASDIEKGYNLNIIVFFDKNRYDIGKSGGLKLLTHRWKYTNGYH